MIMNDQAISAIRIVGAVARADGTVTKEELQSPRR
jgi:hypothetical protein